MKEIEISEAYYTDEGNEKCIQNFNLKTRQGKSLGGPRHR
jgi:hypothetical protein